MAVCGGCDSCYFSVIARFFENDDTAVEFLRSHGVLPSAVECPTCRKPCTYSSGRQRLWRCNSSYALPKTKKRQRCSFCVSDFKGTFLYNAHIPPWKIILFVNHLLSKNWEHQTVTKCLRMTLKTSIEWRSFCSKVAEYWLSEQDSIGGDGVVVEIDDTVIEKRKSDGGRAAVSQAWLFGGVERVSKKSFVVPLLQPVKEKCAQETLLPLIKKYVRPGSVVISNGWGSHLRLSEHGFTHYTKTHSQDPSNGDLPLIHTHSIGWLWRDLKEWVTRPGIKTSHLQEHLARYLFVRTYKDECLHHFFFYVSRLYPPRGGRRRSHRADMDERPSDVD